MADGGIETFNQMKNMARVGAGFKGGEYWSAPAIGPKLTFVDGIPAEVVAKLNAPTSVKQPTPMDTWNQRR